MPDRKSGPAKRGKPGRGGGRGGNRGGNRNVGNRNQVNRNQGGNRGKVQKRFPQSQNNNSQSQQAAKKRLLQAKKTLQLAIQEATKVTRMTQNVSTRGARRGAGRSNFGATRRNNQRNENFANRYLDRLDGPARQSSRPAFYNDGQSRRGRGRGRSGW